MELDAGQAGYNEAILDAFFWNAHLPYSIDALIGSPHDPAAKQMHERFLHTYRLTKEQVPLLTFDKSKTTCPFQLSDEAGAHLHDPDFRFDYRINGVATKWISPQMNLAAPSPPGGAGCTFHSGGGAGAWPPPAPPVVEDWNIDRPAVIVGFGRRMLQHLVAQWRR